MRIIKRKTIIDFFERPGCQDAKQPLLSWFSEARKVEWRTPSDIKRLYRTADILPGNRVVFNIGGNKYRLIVKIRYDLGIVYIRFIGTHVEYDRINAEEI